MKFLELQKKEVQDEDGVKLGYISDFEMDDNFNITKIIITPKLSIHNIFKSNKNVEIKSNEIIKIGSDIILVQVKSY